MRLLTFGLNFTLDGCYDHRGMIADEELHDYFTQLIGGAGSLRYGRTTYELMESYWPAVTRDENAPRAEREWARQKYGEQDWARWRFRTEWVSQSAVVRTVRFRWAEGSLRRLPQ